MNELKRIVQKRIELEAERAELYEQIPSVEKKIKKLTYLAEEAKQNQEILTNAKMRLFFLGIMGKREERMQDAENEIRKTRSELNAAEFELNSMKDRIESIGLELNITEDTFGVFIEQLEDEKDAEIKMMLLSVKELPNLRFQISAKISEAKALFAKAEEIWIYGDIQTDFSGHRYNKKDATLREHTQSIRKVVEELIALLNQYNTYAPEETKIVFHENWMDDEAYWAGQQIAEDSHARIKKVDDWFYRFENCWNAMKKQQSEAERILRDEVMEYLRYE